MKKATTSDGYFRETFTYQGKRYSVRAKTQRDLWRKVDEKKRRLESGIDITNENTTVEKWIKKFIDTYKKSKVTEPTYKQTNRLAEMFIYSAIGNRKLKDIRAADLQAILNSCEGCSDSKMSKLRGLLYSSFRQAVINRVITFNPADGLVNPKTTSGTHRSITEEERKYILQTARHHWAGAWVVFMLLTGARPDETLKAKWEDLNFKEGTVTIHTSKTDYGDRKVPMSELFREWFQPCGKNGALFLQPRTGNPQNKGGMRKTWKIFKKALDIEMGAKVYNHAIIPDTSRVAADLSAYCMRHTYATDLQSAGVPINVAKDLLGHKDISTTSRVYTHLSNEAFNAAAERIKNFDAARQSAKIQKII